MPKDMMKAIYNPEYDPRLGPVKKRGFQIDPQPFKMKQKAAKRKAKLERKKQKYGGGMSYSFNNNEASSHENGIPINRHVDLDAPHLRPHTKRRAAHHERQEHHENADEEEEEAEDPILGIIPESKSKKSKPAR